jgi:4-amino-4-deoxychorismate lyase
MNRSLEMLCGIDEPVDLETFLKNFDVPQSGLYKCRITYDEHTRDVEFIPYTPKSITSLRIVEHDRISYDFKYKDRRTIDRLYELRNGSDDILIVKRGMVTDTSYCNIVFKKGKHWYTPWSALLKGTQRQKLLEREKIKEEEISASDIKNFDTFKLINALLEFEGPELSVPYSSRSFGTDATEQ